VQHNPKFSLFNNGTSEKMVIKYIFKKKEKKKKKKRKHHNYP
jgi:hypothetical protein